MSRRLDEIPRPTVQLIGNDGNSFAILAACKKAARKTGWSDGEWEAFRVAACAGNYDHLLGAVTNRFDVE